MSQQSGSSTSNESADNEMRGATALDALLDVFQVRQYFNLAVGATDLAGRLFRDAGFVNELRRAVVSLPFDRHANASVSFPRPGRNFLALGRDGSVLSRQAAAGRSRRSSGWSERWRRRVGRSASIRCARAGRCSVFRWRPGSPARRLPSS